MDEEIERLIVAVRADTAGFARDVAQLRAELTGPFEAGVDRAGRALEGALLRAIRTGKLGFEDLKRVALQVLAEIAASAVRSGIGAILSGVGVAASGGAGAPFSPGSVPGRATGGPVAPGRAYLVGERGPELFLPTASGQVIAPSAAAAREVRVTVNVNPPTGTDAAQALTRSSRQVARAVRRALES